ncbi:MULTISPECIES: hypothetical protein [unclassified Streptomyces]|uniref:hypothetical protein n=1 Tax=unclassified Streptomyces TaxID=2593676 RepID=UPI00224EEC9D|nr:MULTISPECIES: hypothetical protein [unclassified Streptomyces]MCX4524576.1 hypothetical protein [Streptomyces sp. NBC_01551]MCX4544900.1 hypothetical protein [Streptomyces sp. NBC_01565]
MAQRKGCLIGCGVALVLGIGAVVLLLFGIGKIADVAEMTLVEPGVYSSVKTGDPEDAVRAKLPSGESFVKDVLKDGGPAEPAGSTCSWYVSSDGRGEGTTVYRFCFKDGKLAEKVDYLMK